MKKKVVKKTTGAKHDMELLAKLRELGVETYSNDGLSVTFRHESVGITSPMTGPIKFLKPSEPEIDLDELAFQTAMGKGFTNE